MPDFNQIADRITEEWNRVPAGPFSDRLWWLLIALSLALLFTVQAVETAVEGAWPNQRRPSNFLPKPRIVQMSWGLVALLVIPGALLAIGLVIINLWQENVVEPEQQTLGLVLVGLGWVLFLLFSLDALRLGRLFGNLGVIGPIALLLLLLVGDGLLLSSFLDVVPDWETIRESSENGLRDILPFVD